MALAIDQLTPQKSLSFDEFLVQYGGDNRYELIDGEVFDLEPTGQQEEVAAFFHHRKNLCPGRGNRLTLVCASTRIIAPF